MENDITKDKIEWTVVFLSEFGNRHGLSLKEAFNYLLRYKGIGFVEQQQVGSPVVMEFEIDEAAMSSLHLLRFNDYSEQWAKFILANRNNITRLPSHDYDIVIGPIADDRVGLQLWKYENQLIDMSALVNKLKYMKGVTIQ